MRSRVITLFHNLSFSAASAENHYKISGLYRGAVRVKKKNKKKKNTPATDRHITTKLHEAKDKYLCEPCHSIHCVQINALRFWLTLARESC